MFKNRGWFGNWAGKPKNPHSLDHLKYLYNLMSKNQTVNEQNKTLLVETLRSIAEILIWGDQNDSTVFDFFLEKNMLSFFLQIMKQKCGSYVCVQLLQTLNILFENIRNETSLYYLLSNNHVNSIIVHKFDFSDEEVMAYYISFLKTLSLKLNPHTIHFFFNEHTNDFPLYTEAIKFFNHSEKMVRIAVRTLTLNVFRVEEKSMLIFIRDRTAAPYFSNLVWFIGNHVIDIDTCLKNHKAEFNQQTLIRLDDLVAEHLDYLHYLNDILLLNISDLNYLLSDHLLNRLLIPLYIYSLINIKTPEDVNHSSSSSTTKPRISQMISIFLLSQVFLIISHEPLVQKIVDIILNNNLSIFDKPEFAAPPETLEESLQAVNAMNCEDDNVNEDGENKVNLRSEVKNELNQTLMTDEEKAKLTLNKPCTRTGIKDKPFLESIYSGIDGDDNDDQLTVFSLCLIYAVINNAGVNKNSLKNLIIPEVNANDLEPPLSDVLIEHLIEIMRRSCQYSNSKKLFTILKTIFPFSDSRIRLVTLEISILLLKKLIIKDGKSILSDHHLAAMEQAKEESILILRNFFKSEEEILFLEMFEDEYQEMQKRQLNVEYLMMDANLLLPPNQLTPLMMNGVEFNRRLPCADVERTRYAIRVFFLLRQLSLELRDEKETQLPLTNLDECIKEEQLLDLNNSDLIACTVIIKDQPKMRRFMVIDLQQLILIEPDNKRLGWGVAKFVAFLQNIEVNPDKDDSRSLQITIRQSNSSPAHNSRRNLINAKFVFDDHIRCLAAKQRLTKGRIKARHKKTQQIAKLIELPLIPNESSSRFVSNDFTSRTSSSSHSPSDGPMKKHHHRGHHHSVGATGKSHKLLARVPGSAVAEFSPKHLKPHRHRSTSSTSRDSSPRGSSIDLNCSLNEEMIPMEDLSPKPNRRKHRSKSENRNISSLVDSTCSTVATSDVNSDSNNKCEDV